MWPEPSVLFNDFEQSALVVGGAARRAAVDEILRLAVRRQHANEASLDHSVEVASPRLGDLGQSNSETAPLGGRLGSGGRAQPAKRH
jgi:hypothetical protein